MVVLSPAGTRPALGHVARDDRVVVHAAICELQIRLVERQAFSENTVEVPAAAWDHTTRRHYERGGDKIELNESALRVVSLCMLQIEIII
jgi:hypothetical protein